MEGEEQQEEKKTITIFKSKYTIIMLIIVLIVVFAILFIKIEEQKEHPLVIFNEDTKNEGTYIGIVQEDTGKNITDLAITMIDISRGESGSMDPIVPEFTLIIYDSIHLDGLNFTFYDKNQNNVFDKDDKLIFNNVEKGDVFKIIHTTGKSIFHYTF